MGNLNFPFGIEETQTELGSKPRPVMASEAMIPPGSNPIVPKPLDSFTKLNSNVYIHEPPPNAQQGSNGSIDQHIHQSDAPHLILLFTWMGAAPKHIAKYTSTYIKLFPSSTIVLVRTQLFDMMSLPTSILHRRYTPALQRLLKVAKSSGTGKPCVLAQTFSNGGAFAFLNFARFYRQMTGHSLPISALILDSGPAIGNIPRSVAAIMAPIPRNPILWYPVLLWLNIMLRVLFWKDRVLGRKSIVRRTYLALAERGLLPPGVPRLYVYSLADKMVDWREVEAHARMAEENGQTGRVELVRFERSEHVAHVKEDAGRYWSAVQRTWEGRKKDDSEASGL